mmetsp:Transcript_2068/g.4329  ORF Transcript_2068/g.4329 Transcript_2068/m.4329 type:complete len:910 (-) Transcript_2068:24-2753(-)
MSNQLARKASEAAAAATAFANASARRITETIAAANDNRRPDKSRSKRGNNDDDDDDENDGANPFRFLDTMCGPIFANGKNEDDDMTEVNGNDSSRRAIGGRGGGTSRRRIGSSFDYDDETNATDATGSYDDDDTYEEGDRKKSLRTRRGRDRKPRARSPADSPSEMTGPSSYSEFDDDNEDTETDFSSHYEKKGSKHKSTKGKESVDDETTLVSEQENLISQPLASAFAKRCYFTKAGIGRTTQHYEGLTLTGNTVLMLASAMKLKGCPTICDEDLRRVEQTYPNQFSRLPDELLLSSGWRRISKYCHFSHKPLPDGVPFFHSRRRCHANGGFYFLLCSAVGMTRLMDVEPLNRDALVVLQTDFPTPCEKAPKFLIEDPGEWTLVNKFCFFSGGPINVEEDVYYRAELGGTEIYMLAFLSPSLSPEELYRLRGGNDGDATPLKSVAAVEEVESVYDLTQRDFDDLKLYHLGPCRALPPYLLHPEAWTKVLPPHFVAAREEALRIAREWESRFPPPHSAGASGGGPQGAVMGDNSASGYVELGGGGRGTPVASRGGARNSSPGYMAQHAGQMNQQPMGHDPNMYYQSNLPYQTQPQQLQYGASSGQVNDVNYYHGVPPGGASVPSPMPPQNSGTPVRAASPYQQQTNNHHNQISYTHSPARGPGSSPSMNPMAPQYDKAPGDMMGNPHWKEIQDEAAFGMNPLIGSDQPDDEAFATLGGMYGGSNNPGGLRHHQMGPVDPDVSYNTSRHVEDPPEDHHLMPYNQDDERSEGGASAMMKGAQEVLKKNRMKRMQEKTKRPDLSTKIGNNHANTSPGADDSTWDSRTEGESSYGTSLVSGSSIYTDTTNPNERNSRRALILQMAKARMKNVKQANTSDTKSGIETADSVAAESDTLPPRDELIEGVADLELD